MNAPIQAAGRVDAAARVDIVGDETGLDQLEPVWRALEQVAELSSPCQRWDWSRLWWRHYGRSCDRLWIIVVRLDGEIVGLCPLYVRDARRPWGRRLRFVATGEPEEEEVASEFLDVLAAPIHRALVSRVAVATIAKARHWREVELRNVLETAAVTESWESEGPANRCRVARGSRYTLHLQEPWDAYLGRLAPRFRSRVRAQVREFEAGRQALVETGPADRAAAFDRMVDLHQRHWRGRGGTGAFASVRFREFHRDLLRIWSPQREALLRTLRCGTDTIGVLYNFRCGRQEAYYQSGLDLGDDRIASPGLACHVGAIRQARAEAIVSYDFMLGKPQSYKADYGCRKAAVFNLRCDRRSPVARAVDRGLAMLGGA